MKGPQELTARVLSATGSSVRLQSCDPENSLIAEIKVPVTGQWQEITVPVKYVPKGVQDIKLSLTGDGAAEIDWISFE